MRAQTLRWINDCQAHPKLLSRDFLPYNLKWALFAHMFAVQVPSDTSRSILNAALVEVLSERKDVVYPDGHGMCVHFLCIHEEY